MLLDIREVSIPVCALQIKSLNFNLFFIWVIRVDVIMLMLKVGTDGSSAVESLTI